jgi:iodothyronine deiodinase-like protein
LGALSRLFHAYGDRVAFFIVYIREAHPEDGWVLTDNREAGVRIADPTSSGERREVAQTCSTIFSLEIPVLVDGVDDEVARLYGGWPERLYLIGTDGTIAYQGEEGPFGFHPEELEAAIERELG